MESNQINFANTMFVIKLTDMYASSSCQSGGNINKLGSMSSDLIVIAPGSTSINFFVTYVVSPFHGGVNYKVHCVQLGLIGPRGEDMGKIPNQHMIDIVIPQLHIGSTIEKISSFLQKLIMVECGLHYQYDGHHALGDAYVDISRWASVYSNVSKLITIHIQSLDDMLERRRKLMRMTQCFIANSPIDNDGSQTTHPSPYAGSSCDFRVDFRNTAVNLALAARSSNLGPEVPMAMTSYSGHGDDRGRCVHPFRETLLSDGGCDSGNKISRDSSRNGNDFVRLNHRHGSAQSHPVPPEAVGHEFVPPPPVPSSAWWGVFSWCKLLFFG